MEKPTLSWPESTRRALERLARAGGTVVMLGGVDVGKSTLAAELVNQGLAAGRRVGVVDADVGQSDIGPPTTVGFGVADAPIVSLGEIPAQAIYFVGDTSPARHLLPAVVGTAWLARLARARGCDLVVVDTTGMISGRAASVLKFHKIQALQPRALLAVQAARELEPLLAPFAGKGGPRIVRLAPAPEVRPKPPELRRERRRRALERYLADAREWVLDRSAVEMWPPAHPNALAELRQSVCGLLDGRGATLAVGVLRDADAYSLTVLTPLDDVERVATLQVGDLRLTPEGEEALPASHRPAP